MICPNGPKLFSVKYILWKRLIPLDLSKTEEVRQAISELSRELSTNEIALFSIVLSAEFGQKNLHSMENKSRKNINIKIFLQNFKCCSTTIFGSHQDKSINFKSAGMIRVIPRKFSRYWPLKWLLSTRRSLKWRLIPWKENAPSKMIFSMNFC